MLPYYTGVIVLLKAVVFRYCKNAKNTKKCKLCKTNISAPGQTRAPTPSSKPDTGSPASAGDPGEKIPHFII